MEPITPLKWSVVDLVRAHCHSVGMTHEETETALHDLDLFAQIIQAVKVEQEKTRKLVAAVAENNRKNRMVTVKCFNCQDKYKVADDNSPLVCPKCGHDNTQE